MSNQYFFEQYAKKLAELETGREKNPYTAKNKEFNYVGKYQWGEAILEDLGYIEPGSSKLVEHGNTSDKAGNSWTEGEWTEKSRKYGKLFDGKTAWLYTYWDGEEYNLKYTHEIAGISTFINDYFEKVEE